jgi:hypothetical protein
VLSYLPFFAEARRYIIEDTDKPFSILLPSSVVGVKIIGIAISFNFMSIVSYVIQSYGFMRTINVDAVVANIGSVWWEQISIVRRYDGFDACCMELEKYAVKCVKNGCFILSNCYFVIWKRCGVG